MPSNTIAVPASGRLRDGVLELLSLSGFNSLPKPSPLPTDAGLRFIEMRPRDAAAWLQTDRISAAFISTDIAHEYGLKAFHVLPLGIAKSDLIIACKDNDPRADPHELAGATIATHLPRTTQAYLDGLDVKANVIEMGGSLEGVCAAGLADAIVDLRQTGSSLIRHGLRALAVIERCEAQLVYTDDAGPAVLDAVDRLRAVLAARACRYVMLHAPREALAAVSALLGGLEGPTVLPLAGRDDLVALHTVMTPERLWELREPLTELGCRGIVALNPDAVIQ